MPIPFPRDLRNAWLKQFVLRHWHSWRARRYERWWHIKEEDGGRLPVWHRELTTDFTGWLQPILSPQKDNTSCRCAVEGSPTYRLSNNSWFSADGCSESWVEPGTTHLVGKWFSGSGGFLTEFSSKCIQMNCVLSYVTTPYSPLFHSGKLAAIVLPIASTCVRYPNSLNSFWLELSDCPVRMWTAY